MDSECCLHPCLPSTQVQQPNNDIAHTMHTDPRIQQQYMLYMQQQQQRAGNHGNQQVSPTHSPLGSSSYPGESPRVPPPHMGPVPQVCVTSHENDSQEVISENVMLTFLHCVYISVCKSLSVMLHYFILYSKFLFIFS